MLAYVRKILATLKDAEDATAGLQKLEMGSLTIGMVSTVTYFLPHLLAEFKREHAGIDAKLVVVTAASWYGCWSSARWTSPSWGARLSKWRRVQSPSPRILMCSLPHQTTL